MSYRAVSVMGDEDFISHLELDHADGIKHGWAESGKLRRFASRDTYEVYHDCFLHRAPRRADHEHSSYRWTGWDAKQMSDNKGWTQRTPCVCLHAPQHSPDCTGRLGLTILDDRHGPSAMELIWSELDVLMDGLMDKSFENPEAAKVEAAAYATALACMIDPSNPSPDSIRKEAMRRWKERQG